MNYAGQDNIRSYDVAAFLRELLKAIPGHVIVVWDNSNPHRGKVVKELERSRQRLHIEYLPAYAPEMNPDEGVWSQLKCLLANGRPDDIDELADHLLSAILNLAASQSKLRACVHCSQMHPC